METYEAIDYMTNICKETGVQPNYENLVKYQKKQLEMQEQ